MSILRVRAMMSLAVSAVTVMLLTIGLISVSAPAHAAVGDLTEADCLANTNAEGCTALTNPSLDDAQGVAVSADGKNVYVASGGFGGSNSVSTFNRDTGTGALTEAGCLANTNADGCTALTNPSLDGAFGVAVSADGKNVYVASQVADSVSTFNRETPIPPDPTPTTDTTLTVKARAKAKKLKPGKRTKVVRSATTNAQIKKVKTQCYVFGNKLTGKDKRAVCKFKKKKTASNAKVWVKPKCSVGVKVRVKIVANETGMDKATWQRTWKVKNKPRTYCPISGNG